MFLLRDVLLICIWISCIYVVLPICLVHMLGFLFFQHTKFKKYKINFQNFVVYKFDIFNSFEPELGESIFSDLDKYCNNE